MPEQKKPSVSVRKGVRTVGVCLVALIGLWALVAWGITSSEYVLDPIGKEFLDTVESGEYETAYLDASQMLRDGISFEDFQTTCRWVSQTFGRCRALTYVDHEVEYRTEQGTTAVVRYVGQYERQDYVDVTLILKKRGVVRWEVAGMSFTAKAFGLQETCAACGTANPAGSKYCGQCGALLDANTPEPPISGDGVRGDVGNGSGIVQP